MIDTKETKYTKDKTNNEDIKIKCPYKDKAGVTPCFYCKRNEYTCELV